jgi:uncharacterized protein YerC
MMFDPFGQKAFAEDVQYLLQNLTGDRTRIVGVSKNGRTYWTVERHTGSSWVRA